MTYIVHPANEAQEKAVKAILEALQVPFEEEPVKDETAHLCSSEANAARLNQSIENIRSGNTVDVRLEDLWK